MRGQRLPRKRRFQVGGATPSTFGAPAGGGAGGGGGLAPPWAQQAFANTLTGPAAVNQAAQNAGISPAQMQSFLNAQTQGQPLQAAAGLGGGAAAPLGQAMGFSPAGMAALGNQQGQLGAAGAAGGLPQGAAGLGMGGAAMGAGPGMAALANQRAQLGAAGGAGLPQWGGMPQGAAGLGAGMGAGPGQAGAGQAGNLAALRQAMMRQRGAMAAPGAGQTPISAQVTGGGPGAMFGAAPGFKRGGKVGKKAAGGELEGDTPPGARISNWRARQWGERDRSASDLPPKIERKARGGVVAKRPKGPPKVSIAVGISRKRPVSTPNPYDYEQDEGTAPPSAPPSAPPGMAEGGKWIQGAIKHPGALHKQLGVPQGEKIPAKKLNAAAEKGGTLGKRARLAKTLGRMRKAKGGECEEKAKGGLADRGPGGLFDSDQTPLGSRGAPEKRRPRTGHYGEKERAETKARGGLLGGMPLNRRGTRTGNPEERRPTSGRYGEGAEKRAKGGLHDEARGGLHTGTGGDRTPKFKSTSNLVKAKKLSKGPGGPSLSFAAGGAAKERRGFPNTIPPPKRLAKGGKVRGTGIAQRGTHFSGIF